MEHIIFSQKINSEIKCSKCGKDTPSGNYCINCGKLQDDIIICPSCGEATGKIANFCDQCGKKLYKICPVCPHNNHTPNSCDHEKCPKLQDLTS